MAMQIEVLREPHQAGLEAGALDVMTSSGNAASIRVPAAFTGAFGFKPSFGRVPHKLRGASAPLGHVGPLTRCVADPLT